MAEELQRPNPSQSEFDAMKAEVEAMRKKNAELLADYKNATEKAKAVPQDVDVKELIEFKRKKEQ